MAPSPPPPPSRIWSVYNFLCNFIFLKPFQASRALADHNSRLYPLQTWPETCFERDVSGGVFVKRTHVFTRTTQHRDAVLLTMRTSWTTPDEAKHAESKCKKEIGSQERPNQSHSKARGTMNTEPHITTHGSMWHRCNLRFQCGNNEDTAGD